MKKFFITIIRLYQKQISSKTSAKCKYYPTCSNYAIEAIQIHGVLKGIILSVWRILRCNPFSKGGFDPVPLKKERRKKRG